VATVQGQNQLNKQGIGMLVSLSVQYLLGLTTNLFVQFPQSENASVLWKFAWTQLPLALHIIVGLLLFIGSIALLIRAIILKDKPWIKASAIGLVAILIAGVSGAIFVPTQSAIYSYVMGITFIVAFLSYTGGLYYSK
jgi:hypothetical protein